MEYKGTILITDPRDIIGSPNLSSEDIMEYYPEILGLGIWARVGRRPRLVFNVVELRESHSRIDPNNVSNIHCKRFTLGRVISGSGLIGMFSLEKLKNIYPNLERDPENSTLIKNFSGDLWAHYKNRSAYLRGVGNVCFITRYLNF